MIHNSKTVKGFLCIFVCTSTKAVHLEYVSDLSSDAFLATFDCLITFKFCHQMCIPIMELILLVLLQY